MATRLELHSKLLSILGGNCYYQPPESIKLKYPCLIYTLEGDQADHADDTLYTRKKRYTLTYISKDADDEMPDRLRLLLFCSFDRMFISDNLYHYVFTIYY